MLMMYVLYVCTVLYVLYVCMYECLVLYCICMAVCNLLFHTSVFFFSHFLHTARERALKGATVAKRSAPPSNCRSYALPATTIQLPQVIDRSNGLKQRRCIGWKPTYVVLAGSLRRYIRIFQLECRLCPIYVADPIFLVSAGTFHKSGI